MKIEMLDLDDQKFVVGYDYFDPEVTETEYGHNIFWLESELENISLALTKKQMLQLANAILFLKDNV
jgi:hypothetical protein